ncbi:hypothetical protein C8Q75DRAFT_734435 [Abortiporus biennis]|nr:hypothetical protein C8Q75DRAFT_734435 [Abortiporus biennis]
MCLHSIFIAAESCKQIFLVSSTILPPIPPILTWFQQYFNTLLYGQYDGLTRIRNNMERRVFDVCALDGLTWQCGYVPSPQFSHAIERSTLSSFSMAMTNSTQNFYFVVVRKAIKRKRFYGNKLGMHSLLLLEDAAQPSSIFWLEDIVFT